MILKRPINNMKEERLKMPGFIGKFHFFTCGLLICFTAFSAQIKSSLFQQQIESCKIEIENLSKVKTMAAIYSGLSKSLLLSSEKTIAREILYKAKNENRKITVYNDEIKIFKIQDDETLSPIVLEKRPQSKTISGYIKQLILNMPVDRDWSRVSETRETGINIEITRNNGKITQLKVKNPKASGKILECQTSENLELCLCNTDTNAVVTTDESK